MENTNDQPTGLRNVDGKAQQKYYCVECATQMLTDVGDEWGSVYCAVCGQFCDIETGIEHGLIVYAHKPDWMKREDWHDMIKGIAGDNKFVCVVHEYTTKKGIVELFMSTERLKKRYTICEVTEKINRLLAKSKEKRVTVSYSTVRSALLSLSEEKKVTIEGRKHSYDAYTFKWSYQWIPF